MAQFDRILRVDYRRAHQRLLDRAELLAAVARADVPRRRSHHLVILDLAVLDDDPVAQRTRAASVEPKPLPSACSGGLLVEAALEVELLEPPHHPLVVLRRLVHPGQLADHDAGPDLVIDVEEERVVVLMLGRPGPAAAIRRDSGPASNGMVPESPTS